MSKSISANVADETYEYLAQRARDEDRTLSAQVGRILRLWVELDDSLPGNEAFFAQGAAADE